MRNACEMEFIQELDALLSKYRVLQPLDRTTIPCWYDGFCIMEMKQLMSGSLLPLEAEFLIRLSALLREYGADLQAVDGKIEVWAWKPEGIINLNLGGYFDGE